MDPQHQHPYSTRNRFGCHLRTRNPTRRDPRVTMIISLHLVPLHGKAVVARRNRWWSYLRTIPPRVDQDRKVVPDELLEVRLVNPRFKVRYPLRRTLYRRPPHPQQQRRRGPVRYPLNFRAPFHLNRRKRPWHRREEHRSCPKYCDVFNNNNNQKPIRILRLPHLPHRLDSPSRRIRTIPSRNPYSRKKRRKMITIWSNHPKS
mmetsp:Transcript_21150/g.44192  ORF Transcript_21150/g.44192 Transcript_21150/m.44192 type:complete len:203 (+) Transcript_21150:948-1556(+)